MKKRMKNIPAVMLACILLAPCGSLLNAAETEVEAVGLKGSNAENAIFAVSPDGYVTVIFSARTDCPAFSAGTVMADSGTSGGVFTGDYVASGIRLLGFRIRSEFDVQIAVSAELVLHGASGRKWYNKSVDVSKTGGLWVPNNIAFGLSSGWNRDGGGDKSAMWDEDIRNVTGLGIRLTQVGTKAQSYSVDTFVLLDGSGKVVGESGLLPARVMDYFKAVYGISSVSEITDEMRNKDSDGDGMSDWSELMAGTNPLDPNSVFAARIVAFESNGITIKWPVVADGVYQVTKTESWSSAFNMISGDVYPDATEIANGYMTYKDQFEPGRGPYFYKIIKK